MRQALLFPLLPPAAVLSGENSEVSEKSLQNSVGDPSSITRLRIRPRFPFSRCEAMGEGARRADEGPSATNPRLQQRALTRPSATLSHPADGRGGNQARANALRQLSPDSPAPAGEGGRRPDEGVPSAAMKPQAWAVLKLRLVVFLKSRRELNQHPHPPCRAPSPASGRRGKSRVGSESHCRRRVSNPVLHVISQTSRNPGTFLRKRDKGYAVGLCAHA
jgi:hypothetical protein